MNVWVCVSGENQADQAEKRLVSSADQHISRCANIPLLTNSSVSLSRCSQYVKQQISKLHSELEGEQSFTSILQVVEEEEQRKKAENMQRFFSITAFVGKRY